MFRFFRSMGSEKGSVNIGPLVLTLSLFVAVFAPWIARAGVFSSIFSGFSSIFASSASADMEESPANSQNMALLQATLSPHGSATSSESISIVGDSSLSPETISLSSDSVKAPESDQISIYVVHEGDTLPAIAKMFNVTVNTIVWANDISGNKITPGQTLVILPISGVRHVVKSGDTLSSIAKQHKGDLSEILSYNNLTKDSKISVGDVIVVPDGEVTVVTASSNSSKSKSSPAVGSKGSSMPAYSGYYMRPIIGGIKTQGTHGHNGVDLVSSYGSNILASAGGTVIIAKQGGWNGGYGSYVVLKHGNGTQTLYAHLSSVAVSVGQTVSQGEVIGYMGSTGRSTGTHLHFEIRGAANPF